MPVSLLLHSCYAFSSKCMPNFRCLHESTYTEWGQQIPPDILVPLCHIPYCHVLEACESLNLTQSLLDTDYEACNYMQRSDFKFVQYMPLLHILLTYQYYTVNIT